MSVRSVVYKLESVFDAAVITVAAQPAFSCAPVLPDEDRVCSSGQRRRPRWRTQAHTMYESFRGRALVYCDGRGCTILRPLYLFPVYAIQLLEGDYLPLYFSSR